MNNNENLFSLTGGEIYMTRSETDAFRVKSGTVLIYIVPLRNGKPGRRSFLYEASEGETVPAFAYRDIEYCDWCFCFCAVDSCEIQKIENGSTKILRERFAQKAAIKNFEKEGFNGGLVDQYRLNTVKEDSFIIRTQSQRVDTSKNILALIFNSFKRKKLEFEDNTSSNLLYNAMHMLCTASNVSIAPYEKMKEACGDKFRVSDIARISHFAYREIVLSPGWEKEDGGSFIAFKENKKPVVCLSKGTNSYLIWDTENDCALPCTKKVLQSITPKAYMIYTPLPNKELTAKDMISFCLGRVKKADVLLLLFLTAVTSLIGIITPSISTSIYDSFIPIGARSVLYQLGCLLAAFMISNIMFSVVRNIAVFRISTRMAYDTQSALYDRVFNLPESFLRLYESADLGQRIMGSSSLVSAVADAVISFGVASVFMLIFVIRMASYSPKLTLIGVLLSLVYAALYGFVSAAALRHKAKSVSYDAKAGSLMFQYLNGISKIRIAGVEDRAVFEYLKPYVHHRSSEEKKEKILDIGSVLSLVSMTVFSMVFYIIIMKTETDISLGSFIAFNTVFGSFSSYLMQTVSSVISYINRKPDMERLRPILRERPEFDEAKELPGDISGAVEINNVTFSYDKDSPVVLDGITLDIKAGEYVALVGPSGCGKSTLMKLLLGFEKPDHGKIYYDNKDIESIDKRELRKKMGVVLQDGKLISGSIYENITVTAPEAKLRDVNRVIAAVGLKEDIAAMPMGIHTVLSEDCGTISGGQQQRILIARALISKPRIIFFDEATSALDNITQSKVCETLEKTDATRIVIAHRLSTVMHCDRIIVLDKGKIAEQGTYEELMQNRSLFYELAGRQTV